MGWKIGCLGKESDNGDLVFYRGENPSYKGFLYALIHTDGRETNRVVFGCNEALRDIQQLRLVVRGGLPTDSVPWVDNDEHAYGDWASKTKSIAEAMNSVDDVVSEIGGVPQYPTGIEVYPPSKKWFRWFAEIDESPIDHSWSDCTKLNEQFRKEWLMQTPMKDTELVAAIEAERKVKERRNAEQIITASKTHGDKVRAALKTIRRATESNRARPFDMEKYVESCDLSTTSINSILNAFAAIVDSQRQIEIAAGWKAEWRAFKDVDDAGDIIFYAQNGDDVADRRINCTVKSGNPDNVNLAELMEETKTYASECNDEYSMHKSWKTCNGISNDE